ncbi:MAG: chitobiase/beta-hexosaminidase C-terminal domain-containing protein [Muribaculaceae bacterium]|nr:chitobiase/beta-hexosaminidase C-terminal domain-containing protein [Muribaculaceae bacterium]
MKSTKSKAMYIRCVTIEYESGSVTPTTVATPTFSPDGGTYTSAQNVTIGCTTSGATIRYTTDGSDPTSSSQVYSDPIAISTTTTLKAIAIKDGVTSAIATATYTITSSSGGDGEMTFQRITRTEDLEVGEKYIIVYETSGYALEGDGGYAATSITIDNHTTTVASDANVGIFTLGTGYTLMYPDGKFLANNNDSKGLKKQDEPQIWTITFDGDNAKITGSSSRYIRYYSEDFRTYSQNNGSPIQLYKHVNMGAYSINIASDIEHGTVTSSRKKADQGNPVTITATPDEGCVLESLTVDGTDVTGNVSDNSYTFTMPASDVTVTATFAVLQYGITVVSEHCTVTVAETAAYNSQVTFTVTPRSDKYEVSSVSVTYGENGTMPVTYDSNNGTYSFFMPAGDVTLTVLCTRKSTGNQFTLVKSQDDIRAGGEYVILDADGNAAMAKSTSSTPNYDTPSSEFDLNGETVTLTAGSNVSIFTLADGTTQGKFKIKEGSSYVKAPTSSGNSPTLGTTQSDWTVSYSNGSFTVATTASTVLTLRYNSSHFRVYTSATQGSGLKLYKRVPTTAAVTISPEGGSVIGSQEVEVDATTETAVVRYKVDNGDWSEWTTERPVNFTLIGNVGDTKEVTAQAMEPNQELEEGEEAEMNEASATYTFVAPNAPTIAPATCSVVDVKQSVSITSSYTTTYPGTVIEYSTDDGTTWTTYSGEFDVLLESFGSQATVKARVTVNGVTSDVVSATYTRDIQPVQFSPVSGTYYYGEQSVEMYSVTRGARIYYTMTDNGSEPADPVMNAQGTSLYSAPITDLQPGTTYRFKAVAYIGTTSSEVTSATYTIQAAHSSGYWPNIAAMNAEEDEYAKKKLENPVQVVYMSTYKNNGYKPEYAYIRDNSGYGLVYFGNSGVSSYNNSTKFQMGDWLAGGSVEGYVSVWSDGFHNELGDPDPTVTGWPDEAVGNTPIIPETVTNAQVKAGWDDEAYNGSSYATGVTESNLWGHYVHLHNNTLAGVADRSSSDDKHKGVMTDPTGTTLTYYDVFYKFSGHNGAPHYDQSFFDARQQRGATFDFYGIVAFYGPDITSTTYSQQPFQIVPLDILWVYKPTIHGVEAGHTYTGPQTVSLSLDAVDGDDEHHSVIWYKTSEMDDYAIYTGPFEVSTTTTIEAYTTKMTQYNDQMESNHVTMKVTFTTINPPVISPESAVYATTADPVNATITRDDADGLEATVWFTVDGSDPATSATRYAYTAENMAYLTGIHTTTTVRAIAEVDGVYSAEAEPQTYSFVKSNGVVYELVTNVNQLTENGVYMIVSKNYGEALSTTQNAANRGAAGVMFVEGSNKTKVYGNSDVALFQLSHLTHSDDQSGDNHFLFHTGNGANDAANGYLYVGHETDNTLLTEPEEDDLGNDVVLVTIGSDGRAHLQMNYSGGSNRYIQYWNRDRYFTTYKTEDTERAVYIYYTASTPLAVIEQSGTKGKSYTVADDLQVVYVTSTNDYSVAWARDLVDNNQAVDVPTEADGVYDYMTNAGQQTGQWQQNNWVMLDFGNHADFNDLVAEFTAGKQPIIKGGSLVGEYTDDVNYTIRVSHDAKLELDTQAEPYVPNVYCAANYYGEPTQRGTNGRTYWFMTPKVMEVATHTWSVYQSGDNAGFYMPKSERIDGQWFNEAGLLGAYGLNMQYNEGAFTPDAGQAYRYLGVTLVKGTEGTTTTAAPRHAPTSLEAQPGSAISANREVAPLNLTGSDGQVVTAVSRITAGREVLSVTYSDVAGRQSSKPFDGVNIIVTRYTDGTTATTKVIR